MKISAAQARRYLLRYHGLYGERRWQGKDGALSYVRQVNCLQYDPLSIIDTNPNLVLQSRVADYRSRYLAELLYEDRVLLDGWDKNMSIHPTEDRPLFSRIRGARFKNYLKRADVARALPRLKERIRVEGPLSSLDFRNEEKVDWYWSSATLAKAGLETLFWKGELIIHHRVGSRRYYDLIENHLPQGLIEAGDPFEEEADFFRHFVKRRIEAVGLLWRTSSDAFLGIRWQKAANKKKAIRDLLAAGEIVEVEVDTFREPLYAPAAARAMLESDFLIDPQMSPMRFIAPLDNVIWDRKLIKALFGFAYLWEVYKPAAERDYGYYVLPVLWGDTFVGRVEPVFHGKTGVLEIKNWWWEEGFSGLTAAAETAKADALKTFAAYLGATEIRE